MPEGFTNTAYALEQLGRPQDAIDAYQNGLKIHPGEQKIIVPLINTLQVCFDVCSSSYVAVGNGGASLQHEPSQGSLGEL